MSRENLSYIFEQINNLKTTGPETTEIIVDIEKNDLQEVLIGISEEIQRVLDENDFTQEDLCKITNMSQSNISKILNGKVIPRIETLQKIARATQKKLVISFES